MSKRTAGFTLVELLIVIALLGALAVGLLAALDPFEQLKKGTDTGIRNTTAELQSSMVRFFAIKGHMPWCDPADPTTCADVSTPVAADAIDVAAYNTPLTQIINTGELKADFIDLAGTQLAQIYISGVSVPSPEAVVCFLPTSKSFQNDRNTKYDNAGVEEAAGTCKSQGGVQDCYYCIQ